MDDSPEPLPPEFTSLFASLGARALHPDTVDALAGEAATAAAGPALPTAVFAALIQQGARFVAGSGRALRAAADAVDGWIARVVAARRRAQMGAWLGDDDAICEAYDHSLEAPVAAAACSSELAMVQREEAGRPLAFVTGHVELRDPALLARVANGWLVLELRNDGQPLWLAPVGIQGNARVMVDLRLGSARNPRPVPIDKHVRLRLVPHDRSLLVVERISASVAHRFARWAQACGTTADDVRSEIALVALQRPKVWLDRPEKFAYRVLRNAAVRLLQRAARTRLDASEDDLPSRDRALLEEVIDRERRRRVMEAVGELPDEERVPLELRVEGWSTAQIAEHLDTTTNAIYLRVSRACKKLRNRLDDGERA